MPFINGHFYSMMGRYSPYVTLQLQHYRASQANRQFQQQASAANDTLAAAGANMVTGMGDLALQMAADRIKATSKNTSLGDQLRTLVAVADTGSYTEAAKQLNMRESEVSKQMAQLETQVGRPIFVRGASTMTLTMDGQKLLYYARNNPNGLPTSA